MAADQGVSFRLIVGSNLQLASPTPLPLYSDTPINRYSGDGIRHDDIGKFEVGLLFAVLIGRERQRRIRADVFG